MSEKVTFAIAGLGNRGMKYAQKQLAFPDDMEVTAVANRHRLRLDTANRFLNLPESRLFASAEEMLAQPQLADVMIISTQDQQHREHAVRAMEKGYDLLLEKPASNTLDGCIEIRDTAERLGRKVVVCHVLRYTPFYTAVKRLIDEGQVGRIMSIQMAEHVGYYHIAHSYVRGNWHREELSSPMILAKCCHDFDLMLWLTGKHCKTVSSFGTLSYFKAENAPEGATERCADGCPRYETCPFCAPRFYFERCPGWPTEILHPEPTVENLTEILARTNYGRCVFRMDNDVVDHQIVNLMLEDDITVNFQMCGFTNRQTRDIRIMGTEGEIWGDFRDRKVYYQRFHEERHCFDCNTISTETTGHGGGDTGLMRDAIRYFRGEEDGNSAITTIGRSVESHIVAFAAEESRLAGGMPVSL